jgi:glycosyltransferase involved in cell wall biosynthesis
MERVSIMTKVAIVINSAWQGYNFRLNLARKLKDNNYKVVFIAPEDGKYSDKLKSEFEFIHVAFKAGGVNPIDDLKVCFSLYKAYNENKFDIVLNFTIKPNIYSAMVAKLLHIDSINNITGLGTVFIKTTLITSIVKLLYRVSLACSTHVFFQNPEDQNYFLSKGLVSINKCSLIPGSGVNTDKFIPVDVDNDGIFRFLLVARVIRDKGIFEYIDAACILKNKYSNIEFGLLGELDSINRTAISKKKILELHNDGVINYLGKTDNVREQLANADCVVLPSYREGSPRSLMEASSMAIPIITTDVVGCRQVVDDGVTGLLCQVRDSSDLALKMEEMLNMTENDRECMGKLGREKMLKEFNESIVINEYMNTVNNILTKKSS